MLVQCVHSLSFIFFFQLRYFFFFSRNFIGRLKKKKKTKSPPSMLTHESPVCAANLLFILDLYYLPFAGRVFVCVDSEVVYSMFQFFCRSAASLSLSRSLLYSLCFGFLFLRLTIAVQFFLSLRHNMFLFGGKINNKRRKAKKSSYLFKDKNG